MFGLAYENLSAQNLRETIKRKTKFEPNVVLSVDMFDQKQFLKN